jgi:hypothetical protein
MAARTFFDDADDTLYPDLPAEHCRAAAVEGSAWRLTRAISFKTVRAQKAPDDAGAFR